MYEKGRFTAFSANGSGNDDDPRCAGCTSFLEPGHRQHDILREQERIKPDISFLVQSSRSTKV
jgi:hypothetical protein